MERRVKERLVGAAVLVAAAIILIPEMLSGPKESRPTTTSGQSNGPLKTYTIDLNRSPGVKTSAQVEEKAPPPETVEPSAPAPVQTSSEFSGPNEVQPYSGKGFPESAKASEPETLATTQPSQVAPRPAPSAQQPRVSTQAPLPRDTSAAAIASTTAGPTSRGWAVQAGSFASKATADRIAKDLSASGQNAFVMPVKSGPSTLYRVRIGPFADRAAANETLREVKGRVANAAVVAHP